MPSVASTERSVCYAQLAGHYFAFENAHLRRVVALETLTPLPRSNEDLLGLFSFQGDIFPLFDIRPVLGLGAGSADLTTLAALLEYQNHTVAIGIEAVSDVAVVAFGDLKALPEDAPPGLRRHVLGETQHDGEAALLIDAPRLIEGLLKRVSVV